MGVGFASAEEKMMCMNDRAFEEQFTPEELARRWKFHPSTIRRWFQNEPGVFKSSSRSLCKKHERITLRIPASVAARVYAERSQ
jgi:hypothetical protein